MNPLSHEACLQLSETMAEVPSMAVEIHLLRRNLCCAYAVGNPPNYRAVIIRDFNLWEEPFALGTDPEAIGTLLKELSGWTCVNVDVELAAPVAEVITRDRRCSVRYYGDLYFALTRPVKQFSVEPVRLMTLEDIPVLEAAADTVKASGFGNLEAQLAEGYVACAIVAGQVVATAQTYARTQQYADIGGSTLPAYQKRGFATAAASLVAAQLQAAGLTPVWSAGEDNHASLRVAEKVGFQEVARRLYVILER